MTDERAKVIDKGFYKIAKERCLFNDETLQNAFYEGFLDCAEYLLSQLTEKDKQIEKMKCCGNCSHRHYWGNGGEHFENGGNRKMTEEEIKQKAEEWLIDNLHTTEEDYKQSFIAGVKCGLKQHAHDYLVKTKKLKDENNKLLDVINNQDVKIADLEETCKDKDRQLDNWYKEWQKQDKQIERARQIISKQKKIIEDVCDVNFLSSESKKTLEQAEQFIKETGNDRKAD